MTDTDHVAEARAFVDNLPNDDGFISGYIRNGVQYRLTAEGLRALVAEVEKLRTGHIPLMTLRQTWRNGWMDRGNAIRQTIADSDKQRDAYERAFVRYMSEDPAEDDKDPYRPIDGPDDPAFEQQSAQDGAQ